MTPEEVEFLSGIDADEAWTHLEHLAGLGEKVAGTSEEFVAQTYVYDYLTDLELDKVEMETFATSSWDHHGTSLTVTSPEEEDIPVTTYGGSYSVWGMHDYQPYFFGNENDGKILTGPVVDVGTATATELDAAGDLDDAIVLVLRNDWIIPWPTITVEEIALHEASAILFYGYFGPYPDSEAIKQDAVGGSIPAFSISRDSAERIKDLMDSGTVTVRIEGSADIYSVEHAESVNVVGYLYGTTHPDQYIVFSAHADTWWAGASDDCSGVAGVLELARHFAESRDDGSFVNERTIVFCTFGSEECGGPSDWYDWIVGSYEFVLAHPEILDGLVVDFNLDMIGSARTHGPYWLENTWEINDFLIDACADSTHLATFSYPLFSHTDAWSFAAVGGGSAVYGSFVEGGWSTYHTQLDDLSRSSPESIKDMLDLFALMAIRLDGVLVMPFDFTTIITWVKNFLHSEALLVPGEAELFERADVALTALREEVMATNAYGKDLETAYEQADTDEERDAILADASILNQALIEARQTINRWSVGIGGATGTEEVFLRSEQHVHDLVGVVGAISALMAESTDRAMGALEGVYTMEWAPLCSPETYSLVMASMYSDDPEQMYWAGEFDQQQAYVDVYWVYLGLQDESLSSCEALIVLEDMRDDLLIPWLQEDLITLDWAWTEASNRLAEIQI